MRKKRLVKVKLKKLINAFGGVALYMDKQMLDYLKVKGRDEVQINFQNGVIVLSHPEITDERVHQLLQKAKEN